MAASDGMRSRLVQRQDNSRASAAHAWSGSPVVRRRCAYVTDELGFDACVSHLSPSFAQDLAAACPDGVDVYFKNVGGKVFDAVLPLFNQGARMTICGLIAHYGEDVCLNPAAEEKARAEVRGVRTHDLAVGDYVEDWHDAFLRDVAPWVASGQVLYCEDIREGIEAIPAAFADMLKGETFGKTLVRVSYDPTL